MAVWHLRWFVASDHPVPWLAISCCMLMILYCLLDLSAAMKSNSLSACVFSLALVNLLCPGTHEAARSLLELWNAPLLPLVPLPCWRAQALPNGPQLLWTLSYVLYSELLFVFGSFFFFFAAHMRWLRGRFNWLHISS